LDYGKLSPRGDGMGALHETGKPLWKTHAWRIMGCSTCAMRTNKGKRRGTGEIKLHGKQRRDPYATDLSPRTKRYTDPVDGEYSIDYAAVRAKRAKRERNRFRQDPPRWLVNLQQEPPHGENHGRSKIDGVGRPLETTIPPSVKSYLDWRERETQRAHGMAWRYVKCKCRCTLCREWKRNYDRKRRPPVEVSATKCETSWVRKNDSFFSLGRTHT
jgi:hypothetical protein